METLAVHSPINHAPIYYTPVTSSTMDEAARLAHENAAFGTVITVDFQSQGRGRLPGSIWEAAHGENLLLTVLLEKKRHVKDLLKTPLIAGLSIACALEKRFGFQSAIKWPNDVLVQGKKIAGILCVTCGRYLLIGMGINCNQRIFGGALAQSATSVFCLTGRKVDRIGLLLDVLSLLHNKQQAETWRTEIEERLHKRGELCRVSTGEGREKKVMEGVIKGLGKRGELLFEPDSTGKMERIFSGSIIS